MNKSPFIVYVLPVILSVSLGTFVMAEALNDGQREFDMWQFDNTGISSSIQQGDGLSTIGLEKTYSTSDKIEFKIKVSNTNFECGDLYVTIYEITDSGDDQVLTQSGYLKQCFIKNQQNLPIGEKYSEILTESGTYRIVVQIYDEKYKGVISFDETIIVK